MRRGTPRAGVTLVEVALFSGIGLAVIAAAWSLLRFAMGSAARTDAKLDGVQAAMLFAETLERDLEALYEGPGKPVRFLVAREGSDLTFHRFAGTSAGERWEPLRTVAVSYRFRVGTGRVYRTEDDGTPRELYGGFERVNYRIANPAARAQAPLGEGPAILYSAVATSEEVMARPEARRLATDRTVLEGAVTRTLVARRNAYPWWNPVLYGPPGP
jgi:hypothetical protein